MLRIALLTLALLVMIVACTQAESTAESVIEALRGIDGPTEPAGRGIADLHDKGIWPDLDDRVVLYDDANVTGFADRDGDGIPDPTDILIGAKKAAVNGARYDDRYVSLPRSGGDVPREFGVCTDVVVRSLRNAGIDLQTEVQNDYRRSPSSYRRIERPDPSIDHRRVGNLLAYLSRHWDSRSPTEFGDFRPGDVLVMDAGYYEGPDHMGVVSDRLGASGRPLVINNFSWGYTTREMDLLGSVPVTHRFRVPPAPAKSL